MTNDLMASGKSAKKIVNQANYLVTAKCFDQWMNLRERNICISDYLRRYDISHVAVYGCGMLGKHLISELEETDIKIEYIIDKSRKRKSLKYDMKSLEDDFPKVDAVIVTVVDEYDRIYQKLKERMTCSFFSLYEIVSEMT